MPNAKAIIKAIAEFLDRVVVPLPPSSVVRSNIELACKNRVFHRIEQRPRRHDQNEISLEIEKRTIEIVDFPVGKDILIVDDICTTGRTMKMYRNWCMELGAKSVECLAYGRVKPQLVERVLAIAVVDTTGFDLEYLTDKLESFGGGLTGFDLDDLEGFDMGCFSE
jgi:phosphoribosylpyrophosphate synthetase